MIFHASSDEFKNSTKNLFLVADQTEIVVYCQYSYEGINIQICEHTTVLHCTYNACLVSFILPFTVVYFHVFLFFFCLCSFLLFHFLFMQIFILSTSPHFHSTHLCYTSLFNSLVTLQCLHMVFTSYLTFQFFSIQSSLSFLQCHPPVSYLPYVKIVTVLQLLFNL